MQTQSKKTKNQQVHGDMAQKQFAVWHIRCFPTSSLNHITVLKWQRMEMETAYLLPQLCCMTSVSIHMYAQKVPGNAKSTCRKLLRNKPKGVFDILLQNQTCILQVIIFGNAIFFFSRHSTHSQEYSVIFAKFLLKCSINTMYPACLIKHTK